MGPVEEERPDQYALPEKLLMHVMNIFLHLLAEKRRTGRV